MLAAGDNLEVGYRVEVRVTDLSKGVFWFPGTNDPFHVTAASVCIV